MSFKCPNCQTTLYSRAHRLCRACGVALPSELLLPEVQMRHFEEKREREKKATLEADKNIDTSGPGVLALGANFSN